MNTMYKNLLLFCCVLLSHFICFAQLKSPEQFLGYKIGTAYTPHWKIVEYYKHVSATVPSLIHLQEYGQTNEGRPLIAAFISSPDNIARLENVRTNNLQLANANTANISGSPVIVWLSYNVHGNETSSSEASMLSLFSLVDPANSKTKEWLKNTLVVIDPCLNPDGRDRYVNWFNSVVGKNPNASLIAREHQEPWPGGRTNHYNFDLNRDWAWQTQVESQQRLKLYNEWLPQVHVDFHEQSVNSPYFFAPASEPYHEEITPWQRSFQDTVGKHHARYFDDKGWLYFTREVFDLLYPSYGDTYPMYNGAIGMTYEQGGGSKGGLVAATAIGDTLSLNDRVQHHYTTSLSTIEVAARNSAKLLTEFKNFYHQNQNKFSGYKTYIIKYSPNDDQKIYSLLQLLEKNKIQFGYKKNISLRGWNYDTGKEENITTGDRDIIITSNQAKATLLKVFFEPVSKLSDSVTYDITAWSLPYVYGVKAYASKQVVETVPAPLASADVVNTATDTYGYIIRWNGIQTVKLVSRLLQKGIRLRYTEARFDAGKQSFDRGSVIIFKTNTSAIGLWDTVRRYANEFHVQLYPVSTAMVEKGYDFGSSKVHVLKQKKVALVTGEAVNAYAAGEVWHFFDKEIDYPLTLINVNDIGNISWHQFDVLILPSGNYKLLSDTTSSDQLRDWVRKGGNVIAMENAAAQLSKLAWSIKMKAPDTATAKDPYVYLRKYENRVRDSVTDITPGSIFKVELDNTHPLAFGYPGYYYTLKQDNNIYEFIKSGGWNVGVLKKEKQVTGFVGSRLSQRLQDGMLFGTQQIGNGTITYLADDVLFRSFWENGKLMFANAVFLVGQ